MNSFNTFIRFLIMFFVTLLPFILFSIVLRIPYAFVAALSLILILFLGAAVFSEYIVHRVFKGRQPTPSLFQTLKRTIEVHGGGKSTNLPGLYLFSAPVSEVFLVRSLFGRGRIYLSEGVLLEYSEEQVRRILSVALLKMRESPIRILSTCSILSHWLFYLDRNRRIAAAFSGPAVKIGKGVELRVGAAFGLIHLVTCVRFLKWASGELTRLELPESPKTRPATFEMKKYYPGLAPISLI